ncbi:MAG: RimK family alpha-L-glutamate ligase [Coriobacteriia bacterium]
MSHRESDPSSTVAFLSGEKRCYSRTRFEEEAGPLGLRVDWLDPQGFDLLVDAENPRAFYRSRPFRQPAAFVARTGSDTTLFARAIIRHMEGPGGPVVINSSASIMAARDKLLAHQVFAGAGIPFPRTVLARQPSDVAKMVRLVGGPRAILKLMSGTHGRGVMLGRDFDEIQASLETVWALNETLLIQEYIECGGTDTRVITVGGRVLGAMKRTAKLGSFRANVHQGAHVEQQPIDEELEWLALRATEVLGLELSGVDVVRGERGYSVIEVNSAPGFQGFEKATGINTAAEIMRYIRFRTR